MSEVVFPIMIAIIAGCAIALQSSFSTVLSKYIGMWEANMLVHFTGFLTVGLIVLFFGSGKLGEINNAPKYSLLGGVLGVIILGGIVTSVDKLGVGFGLSSVVAAQLVAAVLFEHFGFLGFEKVPMSFVRVLGIILLVAGAYLIRGIE